MNNLTHDQIHDKVRTFMKGLYLDVQGPSGTASTTGAKLTEEYIIKLVTRFAVSICSAWYAITELIDYLRTRRLARTFNGVPRGTA